MSFGGGQNMGGLLGGDFDDPRTQGVMGLATGLLAGGAPQVGRPVSLGGALAQGLQMGQNSFNTAQTRQDKMNQLEQARQDKLNQSKFQVVGGALMDLSDPANPKVVYNTPTKPQTGVLDGGKFKYTTDADGNTRVVKTEVYDDIMAEANKAKASKPLSSKAQSLEDDDFFAIDTAGSIVGDIDKYIGLIDDGDLRFGFAEGIGDSLLGFVGAAGEEEKNSAMFDTFLEKLRNDTLRLNKGVQTEGDAQRALNEIIKNKNDGKIVQAQLKRLREINERAVELRKRSVNRRRKTQNVDVFDFSDYAAPTTSNDVSYKVL